MTSAISPTTPALRGTAKRFLTGASAAKVAGAFMD
jgi:hypothetical protein